MTFMFINARRSTNPQSGSVLILLVVGLAALITVAAFALNSGNLFRDELLVQRAADAGAVEGMRYRIIKGYQYAMNLDIIPEIGKTAAEDIQDQAKAATLETLKRERVTVDEDDIVPTYDINQDSVRVQVNHTNQLFFSGFLGRDSHAVDAHAKVVMQPATIAMILDLSGSMGCPANPATSCECLNTEAGCGTDTKLELLRAAARIFVDKFNPSRDKIAMIVFAGRARTVVPFQSSGFNHRALHDNIDLFNTGPADPANPNALRIGEGTNTNMSDAFMVAYDEILSARSAGYIGATEEVSYLLYTDSSPTAARFYYANPKVGNLAATHPAEPAGYQYDYTQWEVVWYGQDASRRQVYSGPSPLVSTAKLVVLGNPPVDDFTWPYTADGVTIDHRIPWDNVTEASCSALANRPHNVPKDYEDNFKSVFLGCINDTSFRVPGSATVYSGDITTPTSPNTVVVNKFIKYREQYYNSAIAMSDQLRALGGRFYVVSIGQPAEVTDDAYQFCPRCRALPDKYCDFCTDSEYTTHKAECDAWYAANTQNGLCPKATVNGDMMQSNKRKDVLLVRIAADKDSRRGTADFSFTNYMDWTALSNYLDANPRRQGVYMFSDKKEDLERYFVKIAQEIQLRMTE